MARGIYSGKTAPQFPAKEEVRKPIPARATRQLPQAANEGVEDVYDSTPEIGLTDSLQPLLSEVAAIPLETVASVRQSIGDMIYSYRRHNRWLKPWIACVILVILFMAVLLSAGILQRPLLSYINNNGETVYDLANTWKQQHPTALQTQTPILQSDLPAGLSVDHPYVSYAWNAAQKASISPQIFVRQIYQESGFNPTAVSPVGAIGIAQFMPSTAAGLSNPLGSGQLDPSNPDEALTAAALYMAAKLQTYGGDYAKALASYNAGSGGVQNAINKAIQADGTPDTWRKYLPAETQRYILIILGQ